MPRFPPGSLLFSPRRAGFPDPISVQGEGGASAVVSTSGKGPTNNFFHTIETGFIICLVWVAKTRRTDPSSTTLFKRVN